MLTDIEMLRKTGGTRPGRFEDILTALSSIISRVGKDKFATALMAFQQFAVPLFSMLLTREVSRAYSEIFVLSCKKAHSLPNMPIRFYRERSILYPLTLVCTCRMTCPKIVYFQRICSTGCLFKVFVVVSDICLKLWS